YDIKLEGRARPLKPALADELFNDIGMNMLRTAVWAASAHPAPGVANIDDSVYADDIEAIKNVKAAKPSATIFASVKLQRQETCPAWVKRSGEVDADAYSVLLENYIEYMSRRGVTVDWLGVDNESRWNEGNITPTKYNRITSHVEQWCKGHGVKRPGFIAAE